MMGLMFYIRPDQNFVDAFNFGLDYFKKKYNEQPVECVIHYSTEQFIPPNGLQIVTRTEKYILPRNFWLIQEEKENEI